jgi:signal transduction histidine kinase
MEMKGQKAYKILFVDDEPHVLSGLRRNLDDMRDQWEMHFYGSGQEALETLMQPSLPDLIVCDIMMPGLDGFGVLKNVRENPETAMIPFIFLTGKAERLNMREGMELGADDYLTKPFSASEIIAAINTRLKKKADLDQHSEKKLDELRQNIIYTMPHELRTPLTSIQACSELIMDCRATLEPSQITELAKNINDSSFRLDRLIGNYLLFAQMKIIATDSEKLKSLQAIHIDGAGRIIREISIYKGKAADREEDLIFEIEDPDIAVNITEENLKKIMEEVIDNAFKFSSAGTPVRVKTVASEDAFKLNITDHGRGMTSAQVAKLGAFMQFERENYEQQGSGLGLIIVKGLAELHGGLFTIESIPNQRTSVCLTIRRKNPLSLIRQTGLE